MWGTYKSTLGVVRGSHVGDSTHRGNDAGGGMRETLSHRARLPEASIFSTKHITPGAKNADLVKNARPVCVTRAIRGGANFDDGTLAGCDTDNK